MILWSPRHSPDLRWETSRQAIRKRHAGNTLPYCSWKHRYSYLSDAIHQVCLQELQMADGREKHSLPWECICSCICRTGLQIPLALSQSTTDIWTSLTTLQPNSQHRVRYQNWTRSVRACKDTSNVCCTI